MKDKKTLMTIIALFLVIFSSFQVNATETSWGVAKGEVYNFIYDELVIEGDYFQPISYRYFPPMDNNGVSSLTNYPITEGLEVSIEIVDVFTTGLWIIVTFDNEKTSMDMDIKKLDDFIIETGDKEYWRTRSSIDGGALKDNTYKIDQYNEYDNGTGIPDYIKNSRIWFEMTIDTKTGVIQDEYYKHSKEDNDSEFSYRYHLVKGNEVAFGTEYGIFSLSMITIFVLFRKRMK